MQREFDRLNDMLHYPLKIPEITEILLNTKSISLFKLMITQSDL
jgi:hypothetical protein